MNRDLTKEDVGKRCACIIERKLITDAKIQIEVAGSWTGNSQPTFFICQNSKSGLEVDNKLGYQCSWFIGEGSVEEMADNDVLDFEMVKDINCID